ncbi:MAG: 30S ribosomal protein S27ae [Thermoplasmatales archaeon B_DKE]|nr:MAG: 30S ribosomal protein S27ae [Thermoplasmatales archaeon B_DKE]QRF76227.1 30S ribosomal protein S27ae [Thermoplasmatales archaeon]
MMKREMYKVEGEKLTRLRRFCPRCGPGTFLAEHEDRMTCGKCGYTEFKKK